MLELIENYLIFIGFVVPNTTEIKIYFDSMYLLKLMMRNLIKYEISQSSKKAHFEMTVR